MPFLKCNVKRVWRTESIPLHRAALRPVITYKPVKRCFGCVFLLTSTEVVPTIPMAHLIDQSLQTHESSLLKTVVALTSRELWLFLSTTAIQARLQDAYR